jgi:hypothetical protein
LVSGELARILKEETVPYAWYYTIICPELLKKRKQGLGQESGNSNLSPSGHTPSLLPLHKIYRSMMMTMMINEIMTHENC